MTKGSDYPSGPLMLLFRALERLSVAMAFVSGMALILLSLFIAADVLGRGAGRFYTGATDEISGFVMALAVTWALAYTLTIDKHVRVDLLFSIVSRPIRRVLDLVALLLLTVFAGLLAFNSWSMSLDSFEINALSPSILQAPLGIPQGVMALGFTMLAVQGLVALLVATFNPRGFEQAQITESSEAPEQFDI